MRTRVNRNIGPVLALAVAMVALHAERALADSVTVTGFLDGQLHGAQVQEQLLLSFPDFNIALPAVTHLMPGFCIDECGTGVSVPFTQTTGSFSGHSVGSPGTIDADVTGNLSFIGPTDTINLSSNPFASDFLSETVQWSGSLTITQPNRVLFNGTLGGSGVGSASYGRIGASGTGSPRLDSYQFQFSGVSVTPEPGSIVLLGTGVAWLAARRRRSGNWRRTGNAV
jgi:hypothetical protein